MTATPPEAKTEYSRGSKGSGTVFPAGSRIPTGSAARSQAVRLRWPRSCSWSAEFTPAVSPCARHDRRDRGQDRRPAGSHHAYAPASDRSLVALLRYAVWRDVSRPALLALGVLGVIVLLIALLGDLSDAHATGVIGSSATHFASANSTPGPGCTWRRWPRSCS